MRKDRIIDVIALDEICYQIIIRCYLSTISSVDSARNNFKASKELRDS